MRLFAPACLCLVTLTGSTGVDPTFSSDEFFGRPAVEKHAGISAPRAETSSPPRETSAGLIENKTTTTEDAFVIVAVPSDRPIDIPTQTAIEPVLEPQPVPLPPAPKPVVHRSRQEVCEALTKAAESNDLPVPFFIRLLFQESGFKPDVVSRAGAQGVAQFMPATAASVGLRNPFDPIEAIPASARLLRSLFQQFGNLGLAAAAYNAGPKRIEAWLTKKGKLPQETQGYVKIITGRPAENWKAVETGTPEIRLPRRAPCQEAAGLHAWNGPSQIPLPVPSPFTRVAGAKPVKSAIQLAARKSAPSKATRAEKPAHAKRLRLAVAARGTHK
ncbi:MAG: lytic transglycosylase domain-containing protein [Rhizobiales bacterium]|nr:lytic transglycosylase domain-containing protein [Hyphomicrobiales bacterium]